jgi:3-oxoacyl-[acyl-carrier-protein] synthase II
VGTNVGVGIGGLQDIQKQYTLLMTKGPRRVSPFFVPGIINNLAAGQLSLKYGLKGPNLCITTACSSSTHSIGESYRLIQRGDVEVMMAGGAEAAVVEISVAGFCSARALSQRNDEPELASRPFDRDRDGFVMGEGAAILILEEWEHAKARGAEILAEVVGYGLNADAYHMTAPHPDGDGAARCMSLTLKDAKLNPEDVDHINAHGTSTPLGDEIETKAIKTTYGDWSKNLTVSSTKSMTGHLLGAAGGLEAVFCVLALQNQVAPPTINLDNPSDDCDLNYVPNEAQEINIRVAMNNSFGFGGTNASLLIKKS